MKVTWPATAEELEVAGYHFECERPCSGRRCDRTIFWYTTPAGKRMPLTEVEDELLQPHFADCIDAPQFRR